MTGLVDAAGETTAPRMAAYEVMRDVSGGWLADRALDVATVRLPARDRAWVQELAYGTLRARGRLDHLLAQLVRGRLEDLDPEVLDVLRLGAYQILEMGSVPAYAAVSQSRELARAVGVGRAAGLVTGVLHSLARQRDTLRFPSFQADPAGSLSAEGSHPRWLIDRWLARWAPEETRELVEANNRRPELFLRPIGLDAADAIRILAGAGHPAEMVGFSPRSVKLLDSASVTEVLAFLPAVVQDPAAALVTDYAAIPAESRVLDLCAAPGGKAAVLAGSGAAVIAADASPSRLVRVRQNQERLGLAGKLHLVAADARQPPFSAEADAVLLDVPCTGTGTLRRHPDARWRVQPADIVSLAALQAEMLDSAAALVRPGGWVVYSTCSLEPEENAQQIDRFLERHPTFEVDPPGLPHLKEMIDSSGALRILPQRWGVDGAFAARLRRSA